jgi:AAA+ ATPase superfamily predicted ATPase
MAGTFVGRKTELALLRKRLDRVGAGRTGLAVTIRGRRQVGKSRLVQEFCDRADAPYIFFTATKGASSAEAISTFLAEIRDSPLAQNPDLVPASAGGWPDAFRALASALPDTPVVVVIDEIPWLAEQDELFDGALQTAWDRLLSAKPVLLLLLGSDIHMMERLSAYDRPFFGRADALVLGPLTPADTGRALELNGADAIDAHLISGGLPGIVRAWPRGKAPLDFLEEECADPASVIFSIPEAALLAEFPAPDQARRVLEAIGGGDRAYANIAATVGGAQTPLSSGLLSPLLRRLLEEKRVLAADEPLSVRPGKPALYRVADTNLRLYLAILRAAQDQARRGRPEAAFKLVQRRWKAWRGRAVEPLVREALELAVIAGGLPWPAQAVGGWWNRQFNPEIDIIGADRAPVAQTIFFAGSIKWLGGPFDGRDLADLANGVVAVPGFEPGHAGLVIVSLGGVSPELDIGKSDVVWGPSDVLSAWA